MGRPTGSADLPLHQGRVPPWLASRMARLGRVICEAIVLEYGRHELLRRLAHPFWFQSFGAVMGMDWHSSGITTSVVGALKRGLRPVSGELGLHVCGGRGRHSRRTPAELLTVGERVGLDGDRLAHTSRLVAKVDSAAIQDGFELYLHSFIVADDGSWVVIQQGLDPGRRQARRYHWLSEGLEDPVDEPHAAIDGPRRGAILNLTDRRAREARSAQVALVADGPDRVVEILRRASDRPDRPSLFPAPGAEDPLPHLHMPAHHDVRVSDVSLRRLRGNLAAAADRGPEDFASLLMTPGVGARTVAALALVSEVVHGTPSRFEDPARFALAHGGKDGHPFPVPLKVYDRTLTLLRGAVDAAKLGDDDKLSALRKLDTQSRRLEKVTEGEIDLAALIQSERFRSPALGGRTAFGPARRPDQPPRRLPAATRTSGQMRLPGLA